MSAAKELPTDVGDRTDAIELGPWNAFVSYSRADIDEVSDLVNALRKANFKLWVDLEGIPPSTEWQEEIRNGIANSDAFILCISPTAVVSEPVLDEIVLAAQFGKRIITVLLSDTPYNDLPEPARRIQWIDARQNVDATAIGEVLKKDLDWVERHTYLLRRARDWDSKGRESGLLLRGQDLKRAEQALELGSLKEPHLSQLQLDLISASREGRRKGQRTRFWAITFAAVALGIVAAFALWQSHQHKRQMNIAVAKELGTRAVLVRDERGRGPTLSALLGIESLDRLAELGAHSVEAGEALVEALSIMPKSVFWRSTEGWVESVDSTPDGSRVAAVLGRGPTLIWSAESPDRAREIANPAEDARWFCRLDGNGRYQLVFYRTKGDTRTDYWQVWDVEDSALLPGSPARAGRLQFGAIDPTGRFVAVGDNEEVRVYVVPSMALVATIESEERICVIGFSNDGESLQLDGISRRIRVDASAEISRREWDVTDWATPGRPRTNPAPTAEMRSKLARGLVDFRLSPDGQYLVALRDRIARYSLRATTLTVWQRGRQRSRRPLERQQGVLFKWIRTFQSAGGITDLRFSADGAYFATGSSDYAASLWSTLSGRRVARIDSTRPPRAVALSRGGSLFVTAAREGLGIWQRNPGWIDRRLDGPSEIVTRATTLSPNGQALAVQTTVAFELWDLKKGIRVNHERLPYTRRDRTKPRFHPNPQSPLYAADGSTITVTGRNAVVRFDSHGEPIDRFELDQDDFTAIDPTGTLLAATDSERTRVYDIRRKELVAEWDKSARDLAFNGSGRYLAMATSGGGLVWDSTTGGEPRYVREGESARAVAFARDADVLAIGFSGRVLLLNPEELDVTAKIPTDVEVYRLALALDGNLVAWTSADQFVVWSRESRRVVLDESIDRIQALALAPDGDKIAVYARNVPIVIWKDLRSGAPFEFLRIPDESVWSLTFTSDSRVLASGSSADLIKLTPVTTEGLRAAAAERLPRNLTESEWVEFIGTEEYSCTIPSLPPCSDSAANYR